VYLIQTMAAVSVLQKEVNMSVHRVKP